jgi:hypothetical protein
MEEEEKEEKKRKGLRRKRDPHGDEWVIEEKKDVGE